MRNKLSNRLSRFIKRCISPPNIQLLRKGLFCFCGTSAMSGLFESRSMIFKDSSFKSNSPFFLRQIEYYQQFIDPKLKKKLHVKRICRYSPTCSEYAVAAIKKHGAPKGIILASYRLLRCNPFSKGGFDPVKWNLSLT